MSYKREIILNSFQELVFKKFGKNLDGIKELVADASDRKIYRLFVDGKSLTGIYNENEKENLAFINFSYTFIELGFNVPVIINVSEDNLFYIEEDLGDETLFKRMCAAGEINLSDYYKQALSDLIRFQVEAKDKIDYSYCYQTKEFNYEVIESDIRKFNDYFIKIFLGEKLDKNTISSILDTSSRVMSKVPCDFFLYRDFQPRNIMLKNERLYYIDYQSGRKGPLQYDVASFLYSGSINLNDKERNSLLNYYIEELNKFVVYDEKEFKYYFYYFVFLRLLQVLGSYSYLHEKRNDKEVLKKISKALFNLKGLTNKIENADVRMLIERITSSMN
ncbi:MAG: phosphotransferase [Bacteroidota bacterium]|nr:phosphotransferase [Bacteroidota bacterium]